MNSPRSPQTPLSCELKRIINDRNMLSMRSRMKVLNTLNETNQRNHEEKEKALRSQAVQEILTTEVTYLRQLEILMEVFFNLPTTVTKKLTLFLQELFTPQYFIQPIFEKKLLDHTLLSTLSENIKTLYNISGELVKELKQDSQNIAGAFHKLAPFFKLYSVYAYDYEQVLSLIQTTQETDPAFRNFISKQETRPEVSRKIASLLITPIQRVPRYKLLLKEVLQHTPNKHKEYSLLQVCLVEVEKAARHINTLVAQNEETQKLLRLQKCITNSINLVKPGRKLIKQGSLMRVSRRGNSAYRRYFILLSDTLLYCKGDPENSLTVCCVLPLNKCTVECVLSGGLFRVSCLEETLLLYSEKDDSASWIEAIHNSIKKYTECRQTLRKDSSSRKPLRHNNINLFPSESIPQTSSKRKRLDDETEVGLDVSRIMYLKIDSEADSDAPSENNCLLLFRKFKRLKSSNNTNSIGSHVQNVKVQLPPASANSEDIFIRQEQNIIDEETCLPSHFHSLSTSNSGEKVPSTFKAVGEFFSYVGSSLKGLFRFR